MESADTLPSKSYLFFKGALAITPLSIAVIPWGLLAGSYAIDSGLSPFDSQALSTILYAGAAQLVGIGMIKAGASTLTMLITTFFITARHFLYSVSMRQSISPLPKRWRYLLGFLLTDELFAIIGNQDKKQFEPWYAFGAGFSFYLVWNIASLVGILVGSSIPELRSIGLNFAIAATFIAIVIPTIKNLPVAITVIVALALSVLTSVFKIEGGLIIASVGAMICGFIAEKITGTRQ